MKRAKPGPSGNNPLGWIDEEVVHAYGKINVIIAELKESRQRLSNELGKTTDAIEKCLYVQNHLDSLGRKLQAPRGSK